MGVLNKFFGTSPFSQLHEHSKKVYECVKLMRPLADALVAEDYDKIEAHHNLMSKTEHEADQIKNEVRGNLTNLYFLSVGQNELSRFLGYQDDIADAAEDFAVVLLLRKTRIPEQLRFDFLAFVDQIIMVSEHLLKVAEKLTGIAGSAFTGREVDHVLEVIDLVSEEEWKADRLGRKFARHFYSLESELDTVTIMFLDKYCKTLGAVANNAEKTAKYLKLIISK
ncbi:MAG: TIGR00153 family protein [Phycisphaerae bacterium]|nr:TIGR00153 family protein [Phycisphaerae bacterium]